MSYGVPPNCIRAHPGGQQQQQPQQQHQVQQQQSPPAQHQAGGLDGIADRMWRALGGYESPQGIPPELAQQRLRDPRVASELGLPADLDRASLVRILTAPDRVSCQQQPPPPVITPQDVRHLADVMGLFRVADPQWRGYISAWELQTALLQSDVLRQNLNIPPSLADPLVRQMDREGRGNVRLLGWIRHWFHYRLRSPRSSNSVEQLVHKLFPASHAHKRGVTEAELRWTMEKDDSLQLHLGWPAHEAGRLFRFLDADSDGVVTREELRRFIDVQCVFNAIDANYSGFIDPFELGKALQNAHIARALGVNATDAQRLWGALDEDKSGAVSFAEFHAYFAPRMAKMQAGALGQINEGAAARPAGHPRDQYLKLNVLGEGTFGRVYMIERKSDRLKLIMKEPKPVAGMTMADVEQEAKMLNRLKHPHIVRFVDQYWEGESLIIVTEFADGGDLRAQIRPGLAPERVMKWWDETCQAIEYIHARRIIHRDLKPDNIFLTKGGSVKVGDLGMAKEIGGQWGSWHKAQTECGTQVYMSPEIFRGEPYADRADVWALGCILYELATGQFAFTNVAAIVHGQVPSRMPGYCVHLVQVCLTVDADQRADMPQIMEMLGHTDDGCMASYMSVRRRPQGR
eukprot:TRINITY_DN12483_c0_g1_i1.p1 TRINITY_DN12483_c0_g1~~TRINITY_DN12483_c0_g1_i1.p1  ORF type:complete len:736 (+),score=213.59 TRINITY_DN12483_c0_g1_i1:319-2208(+)